MKLRNTLGILTLGTAMTLAFGFSPQEVRPMPEAMKAQLLTVDPVHSAVIFKINHIGASNFYGRFNDIGGSVTFDETDPSKSSFDVKIKTASVDTNNKDRDAHLLNADFFDAEKFPLLSFKSTSVKSAGEGKMRVSGDLSFHGVTIPITVDMQHIGTVDHPHAGHVSGFETIFTIKRSEFGVGPSIPTSVLGDEVQLIVSFEGARAGK